MNPFLLSTVALLIAIPVVSIGDDRTTQATNSVTASTNATANPVAPATPTSNVTSLYSLTATSQDGKPVDLHQYMGHVALVVNTASKSAAADQFASLEKLYETYKDKGFVILAFPSDDFGHLEPGSPEEIAARYATFKLSFPIFETIHIRGEGQSPVYHFLATGHGTPMWVFHKYLVDKTGNVIAEFPTHKRPDNKELQAAIDAALKG
jgi:glutathione peroxidase